MKQHTIAVIGGTGKAGKFLVNELLKRGFRLRLLVRNPSTAAPQHPLAEIVPGNVRDAAAVTALLHGCDAVVSTLGMGTSPNPTDLFSTASANVLHALAETGIRRYVVITGLNVDVPGDAKNAATRAATDWMREHYPETTADKQCEYALLAESNAEWTLVRLPMIALTEERPALTTDLHDCPGTGVSAASLAAFLADLLENGSFGGQSPFVATS